MSVLISFIDVGERIPNSAEQFLLSGADVDEDSGIVTIFFEKLVCDLDLVTMQEIILRRRCFDSYKKLTLIFLSYPVPFHGLSFGEKINSVQEL